MLLIIMFGLIAEFAPTFLAVGIFIRPSGVSQHEEVHSVETSKTQVRWP